MYTISGELGVKLIIIWRLQTLGEERQLSKQAAQKSGVERFNLRKLSELEIRKK